MLIADEDNNQRDFNAFNYIENEINDKVDQAEVFSSGRSPYLNIEQSEENIGHAEESIDRVDDYDDDDMFGYSYFDTFPNFDSFKINFLD